jgi:hypothetical protein
MDTLLLLKSQGDACACDAWNYPGIGTAPAGAFLIYPAACSDLGGYYGYYLPSLASDFDTFSTLRLDSHRAYQ